MISPKTTAAALFAAILGITSTKGCFLENTDFPGYDIDRLEGKVFSAVECQRQCQGRQDCEYWTYQLSTNSCYMKSGDAVASHAEVDGLVSGPRVCPGPVDCSQSGIDLYGDDIIDTEVANALACQFQCTAVQGCLYWTYIPSTSRCFLKGAKVDPRSHSEAISGPSVCPATQAIGCEKGTDFLGHDLRSFYGNVFDIQSCQELCKGFNNCFFWTYVESTASCYLKDENAEQGREFNSLTHSGARECDLALSKDQIITTTTTTPPPPNCFLYNVDYKGSDILSFGLGSVTKPESCQYLCQYTPQCFYFTFFDGTCYFKNAAASGGSVSKEGAISGPKNCDEHPVPLPLFPDESTDQAKTSTTTAAPSSSSSSGVPTPPSSTTTVPSVDKLLRFLRTP